MQEHTFDFLYVIYVCTSKSNERRSKDIYCFFSHEANRQKTSGRITVVSVCARSAGSAVIQRARREQGHKTSIWGSGNKQTNMSLDRCESIWGSRVRMETCEFHEFHLQKEVDTSSHSHSASLGAKAQTPWSQTQPHNLNHISITSLTVRFALTLSLKSGSYSFRGNGMVLKITYSFTPLSYISDLQATDDDSAHVASAFSGSGPDLAGVAGHLGRLDWHVGPAHQGARRGVGGGGCLVHGTAGDSGGGKMRLTWE